MANYWIRNRGRIQGPLSLERIKGLMRRGRFSRHFHVSYDKKEWLPAEEFPELFDTGRRRKAGSRADDEDDDTPFRGGGSPFDDDDDERPDRRTGGKSAKRRAAVVDDEDDDEDDDDEDWEDDDEWDDDDDGIFGRLSELIETNIKLIGAVLVLVLLGLGWFLFMGETFTRDLADMEAVMDANDRITMAHATGKAPNEWVALQESIEEEMAPLVKRLEATANAQDHIKQELLWIARDDFKARFKELPNRVDTATSRIAQRLARVDEMIKDKKRQHPGTVMGAMLQMPEQAQGSSNPGQGQQAEQNDNSTGQGQPTEGNSSSPPTGNFQQNPGNSQGNGANPNPAAGALNGGGNPNQGLSPTP